jgi:hypothetical protein
MAEVAALEKAFKVALAHPKQAPQAARHGRGIAVLYDGREPPDVLH